MKNINNSIRNSIVQNKWGFHYVDDDDEIGNYLSARETDRS